MSSSEGGYAKIAANLKDLIIRLETLGTDYKPPQPAYEIKALTQLSKDAEEASRVVSKVLPIYAKAVDEQELIFKPLNNLVTKSINYLKAATTNAATLQTAKTIADKLRGFARGTKTNEDGTIKSNHSSRSYDNRVENFKQYIDVLITIDCYNPAEKEISVETFQKLLVSMEDNITAVAIAKTPLDDARKKRFEVFYGQPNGLINVVTGVKNYIKAALNKSHPQYKHIIGLRFSNTNAKV